MIFCARATRGLRRPSLDAKQAGQARRAREIGATWVWFIWSIQLVS